MKNRISDAEKTSFGRMAKEYQKYRHTYDTRLYKLLYSLLPAGETNILDLGCGTGKSTEQLVTLAPKKNEVNVFGADPDPYMLREAQKSARHKNLPIEYVESYAESLPFSNNTFHALISGAAFHWFGTKRTISKLKKLLKKDGIFFIFWTQYAPTTEPAIGRDIFLKYKWKGIPNKFREQEYVSQLLTSAGFKNVTTKTFTFTQTSTIPELIGLLKTNSSYALMSEVERKAFIHEMKLAHKNVLGSKSQTNKIELRVCYGFS